jgi:hypothetical protein
LSRKAADIIAGVVALIALIAALALLDVGAEVDTPSSTTTVTKEAVPSGASSTTTTTVTPAREGARGETTVVEKNAPRRPAETTVTEKSGERSFLERVLGGNGVAVLQIGAALLAAFAAGAVTQRVLLGQYGFKLGGFELSEIAGASTEALEKLKQEVAAEITRVEKRATEGLSRVDRSRRKVDASLKKDLAEAYRRLAVLEKGPRD